jgi:hypothetical protein
MSRWALVSGLQGDLELYEAIQRDLRQLGRVDTLFVLGDLIGPDRDANALLARLQDPRRGELAPQCIYGWWEEQLLAERGYRGERRADPLRQQFGQAAVEALKQAVDPGHLAWLAALCCMAARPMWATTWVQTARRCCCWTGSPGWM